MTQPAATSLLPGFDPRVALQLYKSGRHAEASALFLRQWQFLDTHTLSRVDAPIRAALDEFVLAFLNIFAQADFTLPPEHHVPFVLCNRVISNIVALTSLRTTDVHLQQLRDQPSNFVRLLALYSARNFVRIDRKAMVEFNPELASLWYYQYGSLCRAGLVDEPVRQNLVEHFNFTHPQLSFPHFVHDLYFGSTYVDGACDRPLKAAINASLHRQAPAPARNLADPRRIAVLTGSWTATHSVYRTFLQFIRALRPRFHVTLFQLGGLCPPDPASFDECRELRLFDKGADLSCLQDNSFQIAFYPDVGMSLESLVLANWRMAPIQVCGVGHSVSTFGAQMDYYVAGADVVRPDRPEQDFSERLVLIPGMGVVHELPAYRLDAGGLPHRRDRLPEARDEILVNLPVTAQKLNAPFIGALRDIQRRVTRPIRFRFYLSTSALTHNDYVPLEQSLAGALGARHVQLMPQMAYADFMASMQEGDLTIDTFHFGGCNSIADSLFLRLPTVTWEGTQWYNRIGSHMLRMVGLGDCVATSREEYVERVAALINHDTARAAVKKRVETADLQNTIYDKRDARYMPAAFDHLIANHERLKGSGDRSPIRIARV